MIPALVRMLVYYEGINVLVHTNAFVHTKNAPAEESVGARL